MIGKNKFIVFLQGAPDVEIIADVVENKGDIISFENFYNNTTSTYATIPIAVFNLKNIAGYKCLSKTEILEEE